MSRASNRLRRVARLAAAAALVGAGTALAHVGATGVDYHRYADERGASCCDDTDCRPARRFVEHGKGRGGLAIEIHGRLVEVSRDRVVAEDAPDGRAHWCGSVLHVNDGEVDWVPLVRCVILPARDM
jgi:hypothetical protein